MKVRFFTSSQYTNNDKIDQIENMVDGLVLDMERVPEKDESMTFQMGKVWFEATVMDVSTTYVESSDNWKKQYWGITYNVTIHKIEIIEEY